MAQSWPIVYREKGLQNNHFAPELVARGRTNKTGANIVYEGQSFYGIDDDGALDIVS